MFGVYSKVTPQQQTAASGTDINVWCVQQTDTTTTNSSSNGTLPGVLPGERLVVTSTGLDTNGSSSVNVTGATAVDRISSIEDDAMGTNLTNPYKRLVRWAAVAFCCCPLLFPVVSGLLPFALL